MTTTYPSIAAPAKTLPALHAAFMQARQTLTLLTVNAQKPSEPTLSKASQIFATTDHVAAAVSNLSGVMADNASAAVGDINSQLTDLQFQITIMKDQITTIQSDITTIQDDITTIDAAIGDLDDRVAAIEAVVTHDVRVRTANNTLNNAVANGGTLKFDTIDYDSDGFAPATTPFDTITIPTGLGGIYVLTAWSSGNGNQSTTLGMGVFLNGAQKYSSTNQSISGPGSVSYVLNNPAVEVLHLDAGDTLQMINNSVTGGTNAFTSVTLAMVRIEVP